MPGIRRRTSKKPVAKARARWYAARGYPHSFIAAKLNVTRNTVRKWCLSSETNRSLDRLIARVRRLPRDQQLKLISRVESDLTQEVRS